MTTRMLIATTLCLGLTTACKKQVDETAPETAANAPKVTAGEAMGEKAAPAPRVEAQLKTERGFPIHSLGSAPLEALEVLEFYQKTFQFVPHIAGVMAESPALLNSYYALGNNLEKFGSLTPPEGNIVQMAIAMENECQYCVAGHTMAAKMFFKTPDEQIEALRTKAALPEPKLNALRNFALQVYEKKGRVNDDELNAFYKAGYSRKQALDVVANVAAKVMSNFTNQVARTPLDEPMKPMAKGLPFAEERQAIATKQ